MPTQNPKISAYVPKVVYDGFKQYEKKHGGSMSQAVTQLLADYLGIDLSTFTIKSTGGLQSEIEGLRDEANNLRIEIAEVKETLANLSEKVDYVLSTSGSRIIDSPLSKATQKESLEKSNRFFDEVSTIASNQETSISPIQKDESKTERVESSYKYFENSLIENVLPVRTAEFVTGLENVTNSGNILEPSLTTKPADLKADSELQSLSQSELFLKEKPIELETDSKILAQSLVELTNPEEVEEFIGELEYEPQSESLLESNQDGVKEVLDISLNEDVICLDKQELASRFGITGQSFQNQKSKLKGEEFDTWLAKRDPDGIKWVYKQEGRKGYYFAPSDLSQDLKDRIIESLSNPKPINKRQSKPRSKSEGELLSDE